MKVSVVGLGKLGAVWATVLAGKGVSVIGVDKDPEVVESINWHRPMNHEPGLAETMLAVGERLKATTDLAQAIAETDITYILVQTPSNEDGTFDAGAVEQVVKQIGLFLKRKRGAHVVVVSSTVMPGTCARLEKILYDGCGEEARGRVGLCYCPEFIALGTAIEDFDNPDFVVIGASHDTAAKLMQGFYQQIMPRSTQIIEVGLEEAELAKVALNFWLTVKITFGNLLAELAEKNGADYVKVKRVLSADSRINTAYMRAGGPFGGACFPRDVRAFEALEGRARQSLARRISVLNDLTYGKLFSRLIKAEQFYEMAHGQAPEIGVLGTAFKPGTDVKTESLGDAICAEFSAKSYDPICGGEFTSAQELVDNCQIVFIANEEKEFGQVVFKDWHHIIDPWGVVNREYIRIVGATIESGRND